VSSENGKAKASGVARIKLAIRSVVILLVCWGVWRTIEKSRGEFAEAEFSLSQVSVIWLFLAGLFYALAMMPSWWFWHRTLFAMGQRPRKRETLRAFFCGHLGKICSWKALVVVIRAGLLRSRRVDTTVAATSVFVETLTLMAVGAAVSAGILIIVSDQWWPVLVAIGLMLFAGLPTLPPIFRRLVIKLGVRRANPEIDRAVAGVDFRLMATGWAGLLVGWALMGMSLWSTMRAMAGTAETLGPWWEELPLLTACVALAMVAGFLSLIPGGLFVRELIVKTLIAPVHGEVVAIVSAVLLRLVWLGVELLLSGALYFGLSGPRDLPDGPSINP